MNKISVAIWPYPVWIIVNLSAHQQRVMLVGVFDLWFLISKHDIRTYHISLESWDNELSIDGNLLTIPWGTSWNIKKKMPLSNLIPHHINGKQLYLTCEFQDRPTYYISLESWDNELSIDGNLLRHFGWMLHFGLNAGGCYWTCDF